MILFTLCLFWFLVLCVFFYSLIRVLIDRKILDPDKIPVRSELPFITIVIPARNEERNIRRCVNSIIHQTYPKKKYKLIVVNDNSNDNTESIIKKIAGVNSNVQLINAEPLSDGWTGKNHACWQAVEHLEGEYFCFIDADTKAEPKLLEIGVSYAENKRTDLLSVIPYQELGSITERIFLPGVFLAIAASMDFKKINEPECKEAVANGQFLLFKADAYRSIKGHKGVRDTIMEDIAFAKRIKESGQKLVFIFGDDLILTRMYRGLGDIWDGFSKNISMIMNKPGIASGIWAAAKTSILGIFPVLLLVLIISIPMESVLAFQISAVLLAAGILGMLGLGVSVLWKMKIPSRYLFFLPAGFLLHSAITINNIIKHKAGSKKWKGRTY